MLIIWIKFNWNPWELKKGDATRLLIHSQLNTDVGHNPTDLSLGFVFKILYLISGPAGKPILAYAGEKNAEEVEEV